MSKGEVIRYLSYFIRMNGARYGNELAVEKWKEDLAFVQEYDINTQPRAIISEIIRKVMNNNCYKGISKMTYAFSSATFHGSEFEIKEL